MFHLLIHNPATRTNPESSFMWLTNMGTVSISSIDMSRVFFPNWRLRAALSNECIRLVSSWGFPGFSIWNFYRRLRQTSDASLYVRIRPLPTNFKTQPEKNFFTHFLLRDPNGISWLVLNMRFKFFLVCNLLAIWLTMSFTWPDRTDLCCRWRVGMAWSSEPCLL